MNYDKWNNIGDDSDDEDANTPEAIAKKHPETAGKMLAQHEAMMRLVGWIAESVPELPDKDMAHLVRFIATQDKVICPDSVKRHVAIAKFLTEEPAPDGAAWTPPMSALIKLCHYAEKQTNADGVSAEDRTAFSRTLILAMSALNTLGACKAEGGIHTLAAALESDPNGAMAKRYEQYVYARDLVRSNPSASQAEAVGDDDETEEDLDKLWEDAATGVNSEETRAAAKEILAKAKAAQASGGDPPGMPPMPSGMPPFPTMPKQPAMTSESDSTWWLRLLKSFAYNLIKHGGVVGVALLTKKLYLWYSLVEGAPDATAAAAQAAAQAAPTPAWTTLQTEL